LRGDTEGTGHTRILERLTTPQAAPVSSTPAPEARPAVDEKMLASLTRAEPAPAPVKSPPDTEEKPVDLSKADEKLASLLRKQK
jgi:hypothetical protein